jgi:hypothetical protein
VQRKIVMCSNLLCTACGVCHSDLHVINKDQPYPIPCVLGHEITGEVVEHGAHTDPATVHRFCAFFIPALLSNSPTHPSTWQFFFATYLIPHLPTYPFFNFFFTTYLFPTPPIHPFCTSSFATLSHLQPTYPPTDPFCNFLLLHISFPTYLARKFALLLLPPISFPSHPPILHLFFCYVSQLAYSATTASFGDDPVVAYIRTRIHRDLQLEILLFNAYCAKGILKEREGEWGLQTASGFTCGGLLYHALWWLLLLC